MMRWEGTWSMQICQLIPAHKLGHAKEGQKKKRETGYVTYDCFMTAPFMLRVVLV